MITGTAAATPGSTSYSYDLLGHLTQVTRTSGDSESLVYARGGELLYGAGGGEVHLLPGGVRHGHGLGPASLWP